MHQGHRVLQLIAEAERAARLIESGAGPHAAGERLIDEPAVGQEVDRRVGRFDIDHAERAAPVMPDAFERPMGVVDAAEALARVAGPRLRCRRRRAMKTMSCSWPSSSVSGDLHGGAGIEPAPTRPESRTRRRAAGLASVPLRPRNSVRSPVTVRIVSLQSTNDDAVGEFRAVGVAGEDRAARRIDLGHHVHQRLVAQLAQHPFPVAGDRQLPRPAGAVGDLELDELDRRIGGDVDAQLGDDAVFGVFEDAVAEAVAGDVGVSAACRQRRRRPELPGLLVAEIERLAAGVADRVVVPGGEPEFVAVLRPGVGAAAFGDDRAELRVGDHVDPRRGRRLAGAEDDHVLAAVAAEAAQAVEERQVAPRGFVGTATVRLGGASA